MKKINLRRVLRDARANVAVMAAITMIPILIAAGSAIDVARQITLKNHMQALTDAGALAAARLLDAGHFDYSGMRNAAYHTMRANAQFAHSDRNCRMTYFGASQIRMTVDIEVECRPPTMFRGAFGGKDRMKVEVHSTAAAFVRKLEVGLVMDISNSMKGSRITALKDAAKTMFDSLIADPTSDNVRIALVPYASGVDVGEIGNEALGRPSDDDSDGDGVDRVCVAERVGTEASSDKQASLGNPDTWVSPARSGVACPRSGRLIPLTSNKSDLKAAVDAYDGDGYTAGHVGIAWGWYAISGKWRNFWSTQSKPRNYFDGNNLKVLVIMTDGALNLQLPGQPSAKEQAKALCDEINKSGILVFTIAFRAPTSAEELMKECATSIDRYYDADNDVALKAAYADIASKFDGVGIVR
ncbi:MAG: vWA domain-containing protein [Pseudomonadota bacterium]